MREQTSQDMSEQPGELPVTTDELLVEIHTLAGRCRDLLHELCDEVGKTTESVGEARKQLISVNIWAKSIGVFEKGQNSLVSKFKGYVEMSIQTKQLLLSLKSSLGRLSLIAIFRGAHRQ